MVVPPTSLGENPGALWVTSRAELRDRLEDEHRPTDGELALQAAILDCAIRNPGA